MLKFGVVLLLTTFCLSVDAAGAPIQPPPKGCTYSNDAVGGRKQLSCIITKLSDCNNLLNTPYARNLFCPSAYGAAYSMRQALVKALGPRAKSTGAFIYYQTLPDNGTVPIGSESQTLNPCMKTPAPWNSSDNIGGGLPLCTLLARAASFNARPLPKTGYPSDKLNPVISTNHYTRYFKDLIFPTSTSDIVNFRENSTWDRIVEHLGSSGAAAFLKMQPLFENGTAYNPWKITTQPYFGISGGGGEGWGSEIGIGKDILLEFGGGGGAGMTSYLGKSTSVQSRVGAGGGGGVNFGAGYIRNGTNYNGLGLGAGADYETGKIKYSHYSIGDIGNGQLTYNATVVAQYISEMKILRSKLKAECAKGKTVVYQGGGGAGAGAEFLKSNGDQYEPHAISTQAGFSFSYGIRCTNQRAAPAPIIPAGLYAELGKIYTKANEVAQLKCKGWSNYGCICRSSHAYVVAVVKKKYKVVPDWLKSSNCPSNKPPVAPQVPAFPPSSPPSAPTPSPAPV